MYDAIIVGARCAGSALGLLLAHRGYRVLLVDRDTFPSDMPMSSHFVPQRGVACLARVSLHVRRPRYTKTLSQEIRGQMHMRKYPRAWWPRLRRTTVCRRSSPTYATLHICNETAGGGRD
jgi:flavin-dependent dehydrogenase